MERKLTKLQQKAYSALSYEWEATSNLNEKGITNNLLEKLVQLGYIERKLEVKGVYPFSYRRANYRRLSG